MAGRSFHRDASFPTFDRKYIYHDTRLGKEVECVLVDPGAHDNLMGGVMATRLLKLLGEKGKSAEARQATTPITVSGVGNGTNSANVIMKFPGAIVDSDSNAREITFEAPVIPGADMPAL